MDNTPNQSTKKLHFQLSPDLGTLSYESTKKYFSTLGLGIFALEISMLVFAYLAVFCISTLYPSIVEHTVLLAVANHAISFVSLYCVGLPILMAIIKRLPKVTPLKQKMSFSQLLAGLCIAMLLMQLGNYISTYLLQLLQAMKGSEIINPVASSTAGVPWWINLIFMAILAPILEEILFRKILCDRLLPLGEGWAVFLSAAIFGLGHGNFYQSFYAFALGALFAFIYVKTGKLVYSTIYHMTINFLGGVIAPILVAWMNKPQVAEFFESIVDSSAAESVNGEQAAEAMAAVFAILAYEIFMIALAVAGAVFMIKAIKAKKFSLDGGLLPPVKEGKMSALFLNLGTALAIAIFTFNLVVSIL